MHENFNAPFLWGLFTIASDSTDDSELCVKPWKLFSLLLSGDSIMISHIHRAVFSGNLKGIPLQTCRAISLCSSLLSRLPLPQVYNSRLIGLLNSTCYLLNTGRLLSFVWVSIFYAAGWELSLGGVFGES